MRLRWFLVRFPPPDAGASAVEYSLIVAGIAAVIVGALMTLGGVISRTLDQVAGNLHAPVGVTDGPTPTYSPSKTSESSEPSISDSTEPTACTSSPSPTDVPADGSPSPSIDPCSE